MTKLGNLLAVAPDSFIKDADIESPDEQQLEQDFANMAFVFLRDRAPALMPHLLGFEVVDLEPRWSKTRTWRRTWLSKPGLPRSSPHPRGTVRFGAGFRS